MFKAEDKIAFGYVAYGLYGLYNLIYQVFIFWFLLYANSFLNFRFIPSSLQWKEGKLKEDLTGLMIALSSVLIIEALLLILTMYYINKWFLSKIIEPNSAIKAAKWTAYIYTVITLGLIATTSILTLRYAGR